MDDIEKDENNEAAEEEAKRKKREALIKQLSQVVCICKGIKLSKVLKGLESSHSVEDVNRKVGTGSGGCAGERCGPRIKALLKRRDAQKK